MSEHKSTEVDRLEAYLDNLLAQEDADEFLGEPDNRKQLEGQAELQAKIDESIRRIFRFDPLGNSTLDKIEETLSSRADKRSRLTVRQKMRRWAIAASLFVLTGFGIWQATKSSRVTEPPFQVRPLAEIYSETVEQGFSPDLVCHDRQLFAQVFEIRQGQRLQLGDLPNGSRMLGISYLGGLSRMTTAMLCNVDNENVIVFVDNAEHDVPEIVVAGNDGRLNVFRAIKNGLVFYEISPLDQSTMIEHFVLLP